jgi:hypothetical protein
MTRIAYPVFLAAMFAAVSYGQNIVLGFGCFGALSGFVGYEIRDVEATGLNAYLDAIGTDVGFSRELEEPFEKFETLYGFRFGVNFARVDFDPLFFSVKGYYAGLSKKNFAWIDYDGERFENYVELKTNNFAVGVDFGVTVVEWLRWKAIDAALTITSARLTGSFTEPGARANVTRYEGEEYKFGYNLGSGVIVNVVGEYVSLEGTIAYAHAPVGSLREVDEETFLPETPGGLSPMTNAIDRGGISTSVQLNLGFPL